MQIIVVYGLRFQGGEWRAWEHTCSMEERDALLDSAKAKAEDHGRSGCPTHLEYLEGSRYIFDVGFGPRDRPAEGDRWVYGIRVDRIMIGDYEELKKFFPRT